MGGELKAHAFLKFTAPLPCHERRFYVFIAMLFSYSFIKKKHGFVAILKYLARAVPFETFLWPQSKSFQDCGTREVDSLLETASGELQGLGIKKKIALLCAKQAR